MPELDSGGLLFMVDVVKLVGGAKIEEESKEREDVPFLLLIVC